MTDEDARDLKIEYKNKDETYKPSGSFCKLFHTKHHEYNNITHKFKCKKCGTEFEE